MRLIHLFICLMAPLWGSKNTGSLDANVTVLQGIDVSHYQQEIAWETVVEKNDLQFAFVKATEGSDFSDSLFCRNWSKLRALGLRRGAYHFFRPYGCGFEQALHFLQTVELEAGDLAPVLDLETTDGVPTEVMLEEARIWLQTVERSLNVRPIIYTNQNFYEKYLAGVFDNHPLWIARYSEQAPKLSGGMDWRFWQYSNEGCLDGIPQKVDLNVFSGTPQMLDRLCWFPSESLSTPLDAKAAP
ncbi:MAG: glycoside hydrolase family 25 protein [Saprospiraceae bacterium]|nr:glycoside hydrolase family 25 protein [Saprospiraceae bacterium]